MPSINIAEAKTRLSKLVDRIARGQDDEIIIVRNGHAAARLVPIARHKPGKRIGLLKGKFKAPALERLDTHNAAIALAFTASVDCKPAEAPQRPS